MKTNMTVVTLVTLTMLAVSLWGSPPPSGHQIGLGQFLGGFSGNGEDGKYSVSNMQSTCSDSMIGTWHPVTNPDGEPDIVMVLKKNSAGRMTGELKMKIFTGYGLKANSAITVTGIFVELSRREDLGSMTFSYKFTIIDTDGIHYMPFGDSGSGEWNGTLLLDWNKQQPYPTRIRVGPDSKWEATIIMPKQLELE